MASTTRKTAKPGESTGRVLLQRADWVRAGLTALASAGPNAVNIALLAERLGVTKGSFYWHFASKDELLDGILEEWKKRATDRVIEIVESATGDAREKIGRLAVLGVSSSIEEKGGSLELAMRTWARSDKRVRSAVAAVDRQRVEYLENLFREALPEADASLMACVHYAFSAGLRTLLCYSDADKLKLRNAAVDQIFFPPQAA